MDEKYQLEVDQDVAGRPISDHAYVALGRARTPRFVTLALSTRDSLAPVRVAGFGAHWTRDAMMAFGSLKAEARRLDPVLGQTLPYTGLRALLELGIASISRIDPSVGLFSPPVSSRDPIMSVDGHDQGTVAGSAATIVTEWLDNYLVPTFERVGVDPSCVALQALRKLIAAGRMLRFETYEERLFPWAWSEQTGTAKVQGNPFRALADHLARTLEGAIVFEGLGPLCRTITRFGSEGSVELVTAPIQIVEDGPFSLVVRLVVRTLPGMHQPLVTVDVSKRRWASRLREDLRVKGGINGSVLSETHPTRVFGFSCSRRQQGSVAIWKPDVAFQALQRRLGLPLVSTDAHRIARGEASTGAAKVLLTYRPRLQDKDHPVLVGVPERDKLEAFDRVAAILAPVGLLPLDRPVRVRAPKGDADLSARNLTARALLQAAIEFAEANPLALASGGGTVEAVVDMLRGHLAESLRRLGARRADQQPQQGSGLLAELLEANTSAIQQLYPEGRPLLVVFHEVGASAHVSLLKAAVLVLWGNAVELVTNHVPPGAHGPKAGLPGANERVRERAQRRDEAWRHVAGQIATLARRTFCIVMAAEWYPAEDGTRKHDDPVNKPAGRRALAKHGGACVQYLLPPQATKAGAVDASNFLQRVQAALRELVLAHSGRVAAPARAVEEHFQRVPEAARPREVIGITIIRRNAKRPIGKRDPTFLAVALRLDVPTGRVDLCCAHEGTGNPTVTAWERLPDALATIAGLSPARLADSMDLAKQRFMRFVEQVISEAVDRDANPVVIIDSTNCVRLWPWLTDQRMDAAKIDIVDREWMNLEWAGARIVRVRQDQAPGLIEDKVKKLGLSSHDDSRAIEDIPCDFEVAAPSSAKGLYRIVAGPLSATYWSIAEKMLHRNARGPSCYRPTTSAPQRWMDDKKALNGGGHALLSVAERPAWTNQWPTPNALEIVISLKHEDDERDDIASFVHSLRYGFGHYGEGTTLPAPSSLSASSMTTSANSSLMTAKLTTMVTATQALTELQPLASRSLRSPHVDVMLLVINKDRPILFTAAAWADVLLTLDRHHFGNLLGGAFYGLVILKPGDFLKRERAVGRMRIF